MKIEEKNFNAFTFLMILVGMGLMYFGTQFDDKFYKYAFLSLGFCILFINVVHPLNYVKNKNK